MRFKDTALKTRFFNEKNHNMKKKRFHGITSSARVATFLSQVWTGLQNTVLLIRSSISFLSYDETVC